MGTPRVWYWGVALGWCLRREPSWGLGQRQGWTSRLAQNLLPATNGGLFWTP